MMDGSVACGCLLLPVSGECDGTEESKHGGGVWVPISKMVNFVLTLRATSCDLLHIVISKVRLILPFFSKNILPYPSKLIAYPGDKIGCLKING